MAINDTKKNVLLGQSVEEQVKNIDDNFTSLFDTVDDLNDGINTSGFITKDVDNLTNYTVKTETGTDIELSLDTTNYKMTLNLKNAAGTVVSTQTIDFPIESMVVNATYASGTLTLTLQNGTTLDVDISAIISGLVPDTRTVNGKQLNANVTLTQDDVSDGTTYKRFSQTEKTKLSGIAEGANKYTHPSYTAKTKGLYKITVDATGHVSEVEEVGVASTTADGLMSKTDKANVNANTAARHSHGNKTLLDTYDQTNANIKDAVTKKHSHSNKNVLDNTTASYTTADKEKLDAIDDSLKNVTADQIGKVKDVEVNGTSVLGTDGVAAITIADLEADFVSVATTDSVWKTNGIMVNGTTYQAIRVEKTDSALGVFNSAGQEIIVQKVVAKENNVDYLYLCVGTTKIACTIRKLSGGAVGTGGSGGGVKYLHQLDISGHDMGTEKNFAICAMYVSDSGTTIETFGQLVLALASRRIMATGYYGGANTTKPVYSLTQSNNGDLTIHTVTNSGVEAVDIDTGAISFPNITDNVIQI